MKPRAFVFRAWGGRRKGAGRKPTRERAGVPHRTRALLKARFPVHATWRMRKGVWGLRTRRCFTALSRAFYAGADRFGFKLVHYSVQGNHLHLMVEARDEKALAKGMNALGVRIARGLNRVMGRRGPVLDDRYHAHILRSPTEARRARNDLLHNARKHFGVRVADPYTTREPLIEPDTFLMRRLC